jgi:hypothetical protein
MPITTPNTFKEIYRDGHDHFKHVLECLLIPAVERSDFKPISPKAKGSELIHADIIKHLENSDLVLCDMSSLNPNVFFEFGIRTSLNKPVCVIKDEQTKHVPFDTGMINYHEYLSTLEPWELNNEIDKLSEHIKSSFQRSEGKNTLWKYFGLRTEAAAYESEPGGNDQLDYIALQLEAINRKIEDINQASKFNDSLIDSKTGNKLNQAFPLIKQIAIHKGIKAKLVSIAKNGREIEIEHNGAISKDQSEILTDIVISFFPGYFVSFYDVPFHIASPI